MNGLPEHRTPGPVLARVLAAFVALPLAGVVVGVLWEGVWTPPRGVVLRREWVQDPVAVGGDVTIEKSTDVEVATLAELEQPEYAEPVEPE